LGSFQLDANLFGRNLQLSTHLARKGVADVANEPTRIAEIGLSLVSKNRRMGSRLRSVHMLVILNGSIVL
jgi:hypothetical protein